MTAIKVQPITQEVVRERLQIQMSVHRVLQAVPLLPLIVVRLQVVVVAAIAVEILPLLTAHLQAAVAAEVLLPHPLTAARLRIVTAIAVGIPPLLTVAHLRAAVAEVLIPHLLTSVPLRAVAVRLLLQEVAVLQVVQVVVHHGREAEVAVRREGKDGVKG